MNDNRDLLLEIRNMMREQLGVMRQLSRWLERRRKEEKQEEWEAQAEEDALIYGDFGDEDYNDAEAKGELNEPNYRDDSY